MQDFSAFSFIVGLAVGAGGAWFVAKGRMRGEAGLSDRFKALAAETLRENNRAFLDLAEVRLKQSEQTAAAQLDKKSTAIDEMIKPVKETLQKFDEQIRAIEIKREGAYRELSEMVRLSHEAQKELRGETSQLLQALQAPTSRGSWGQMQLRRILEMTGMAAHARDFTEQHTIQSNGAGETGVLRPDFIVNLPGDRCVVFDSKVPLTAYMEYVKSGDGPARDALALQHAKQVREHIRSLSSKEYASRIETSPEFVVLFMPGDHLLAAALDNDPDLMDFSVGMRVVLATPTTVIALLWAVAHGWKQEALRDNVRKVGALGGELYNALAIMTKHFLDLGNKLSGSVKSYNDTLGSLDRNVLGKARRLRDYGAGRDGKALPDTLEPIESQPRALAELPPANEDAA
jgi:DNA recombination protein RmuC